MIFGIIALIVIVLIVLWGVSAYNGLVTLRNRVKNGWAQIDVQLKQRADLIPNLVETVKGYAAHESQVFTQVTQARASALQAAQSGDVAQRIQAENQLSRAIMNLQAVAEAYPQLQANQNFLDLQGQLKELYDKKTELENLEIVNTVRAMVMDKDQIMSFLAAMKDSKAEKPTTTQQEVTDND